MAAVSLLHVTKAFGTSVVLDDFNLFIADGELMVLLGPSGCGKSTILRIIAGLEPVTSGEVHFDDRDVTGVPTVDRDVAMVFQDLALYGHLSAGRNIRFPLQVRKVDPVEADARVEHEARRLGVSRLLGHRPRELSGGHQHAVATGRAMVRESSVLLMDEPLAQLDGRARLRARTEIARTQRALGNTMVYVTNDHIEAMTLGSRVAVLNEHGALQQVGAPRQLYRHPANLFVGQFMGTLSIVPARVDGDGSGVVLFIGNDRLVLPPEAVPASLHTVLGGAVLVGFRPEHLRPAQPGEAFQRCLHTTVRAVEQLGSSVFIHAMLGTTELIARSDAEFASHPGDALELAIDPERLLFFDAGTEAAID